MRKTRDDYAKMTEQQLRSYLASARDRLDRPHRRTEDYLADAFTEQEICAAMRAKGFHTYTGHYDDEFRKRQLRNMSTDRLRECVSWGERNGHRDSPETRFARCLLDQREA